MELKDIIRGYKEKNHLTNVELAKILGVAHTTVGRWLNGEVDHLRDDTAERMSDLLGYDIRGLLRSDPVFNFGPNWTKVCYLNLLFIIETNGCLFTVCEL